VLETVVVKSQPTETEHRQTHRERVKVAYIYLVLEAGNVLPINAFINDVDAEPFNSDSLSHFLHTHTRPTDRPTTALCHSSLSHCVLPDIILSYYTVSNSYSSRGRQLQYWHEHVCLSVCLSVCMRAYLMNNMSKSHQIFSACLPPPVKVAWQHCNTSCISGLVDDIILRWTI